MAQVSISEGARLAGVSRSTLNRHLKEGLISKHRDRSGRPYVETSELLRHYGELSQSDSTESDSVGQHGTGKAVDAVSELELKLIEVEGALDMEKMRRELAEERQERAEQAEAHWRQHAERLTTLLADQRQASPQAGQPFWKRLFG